MALAKKDLDVLKAAAEIIKREAQAAEPGSKVAIPGFGAFHIGFSKPKIGRNPATGQPLDIPAKRTFKFKISTTWAV